MFSVSETVIDNYQHQLVPSDKSIFLNFYKKIKKELTDMILIGFARSVTYSIVNNLISFCYSCKNIFSYKLYIFLFYTYLVIYFVISKSGFD